MPLPAGASIVFYDGNCGFCQGWVRFLLRHEREAQLRFAPLHGAAWRECAVVVATDSVVVITANGRTLITWQAVRFLARTLSGPWRIASWPLAVVPSFLGEFLYARIASLRYRLAKKPTGNCPLLSTADRQRFDLRA